MPWLSQEEVRRVHDAVVRGGLQPSAARCGLDPRLTATLPMYENRSAQLLGDIHELNRIGRLSDGTQAAKVWLRTAMTLLGPRAEAAALGRLLKKNPE